MLRSNATATERCRRVMEIINLPRSPISESDPLNISKRPVLDFHALSRL